LITNLSRVLCLIFCQSWHVIKIMTSPISQDANKPSQQGFICDVTLGLICCQVFLLILILRSAMANQSLNMWYLTKLVVFLRSSAVPLSLVFRVVGSGQKCCRLEMLGQVCRICSGVCSLSPHSQTTEGWSPIFLRCWWSLQCPVHCRYVVTWVFLSSWWMLCCQVWCPAILESSWGWLWTGHMAHGRINIFMELLEN
jgi:hypothetical protein